MAAQHTFRGTNSTVRTVPGKHSSLVPRTGPLRHHQFQEGTARKYTAPGGVAPPIPGSTAGKYSVPGDAEPPVPGSTARVYTVPGGTASGHRQTNLLARSRRCPICGRFRILDTSPSGLSGSCRRAVGNLLPTNQMAPDWVRVREHPTGVTGYGACLQSARRLSLGVFDSP